MKNRNTKQKELILDTLKLERTHPTIQELYQKVSLKDESIGQATVYRNVNKFVEQGLVKRLKVQSDIDRYDYCHDDHFHFFCIQCGKVIDLYDNNLNELLDRFLLDHHLLVTGRDLVIEGYCEECKNLPEDSKKSDSTTNSL